MANEEFKKTSELVYSAPAGEWDFLANILIIVNEILKNYPDTNLELSRKEAIGFLATFKDEVLLSLLLDKRKMRLNEFLTKGFDFRGIKIRVS